MKKNLPQIIKDVGFDFHWDNEKVWALDLPTKEIPIDDLSWHFDIPFWSENNGFYNLAPKTVLENKDKYADRIERIMVSDISYPLDVMEWKGRLLLLDGLHRLTKHYILGNKKIKVRKVPKEKIPQILKTYTDKDYLKKALKQAKESVRAGGFPAGAIIVKDGQIISEGISIGYKINDPTSHAETSSIRDACKDLKTTDLTGATLYASLQPCLMCFSASNWANISRIVYGCKKTNEMAEKIYYEGFNNIEEINSKNIKQIELVYIPDFEEEILQIIEEWHN